MVSETATTYVCEGCNKTFDKNPDWDPNEEYEELFVGPGKVREHIEQKEDFDVDDKGSLCDDCFKSFCYWAIHEEPEMFSRTQLDYYEKYLKE